MNELQQKFNLYDHLGYILTGLYQIFVLWVFYVLLTGGNFVGISEFLKIEFSIALILSAYLVGHLVQAISNIFDSWERKKKEENDKDLNFVMDKAREFFSLPKELSGKKVWQYCYLYALSNDFSGHVALFNSMYSLYRGFWVASYVGGICSGVVLLVQCVNSVINKFSVYPDWKLFVFTCVTFGLGILFNRRKKRFFKYMGEKTLITFDILSKDLIQKK